MIPEAMIPTVIYSACSFGVFMGVMLAYYAIPLVRANVLPVIGLVRARLGLTEEGAIAMLATVAALLWIVFVPYLLYLAIRGMIDKG